MGNRSMSEKQIISILQKKKHWMTSREIKDRMTQGQGHLHKKLRQLSKFGLIEKKVDINPENNRQEFFFKKRKKEAFCDY